MKIIKWICIWMGYQLLKYFLRYRISGEQASWLQKIPAGRTCNRKDFILQHCTDQSVLHIGFADAPFTGDRLKDKSLLHYELKKVVKRLSGLDTDKNAVEVYLQYEKDDDVKVGFIEEMPKEWIREFEVILLGEVLEHMKDPHGFMEKLSDLLIPGQKLLVTVPSYQSADNLAASLNNKESIHPDHYWYFSPYTLLRLFPEKNWECENFAHVFYGNNRPNMIQRKFPQLADGLAGIFVLKTTDS